MQTLQHAAQSLEYAPALQSQITQLLRHAFQQASHGIPDASSVTAIIDGWSESLERLLVHLAILLYLLKKGAGTLAVSARNAWKALVLLGRVLASIGRSIASALVAIGRAARPLASASRRTVLLIIQVSGALARRLK